jgi:predicted alpha/beta-hydrolase family hydrolase
MAATKVRIKVNPETSVSGLLLVPDNAKACFVLAHGAGAGMTHPFMAATATGLHDRGIATLRYQFAYMESGSRRPDAPALAHAAVRAAVREANARLPGVPLIAGGKSFGGRMTSQAQAEESLANVRGLAFLGFPLHPAGKPSVTRAQHLFAVRIPILFLQGTRDALADPALIATVTGELKGRATLISFEDADHSFHVPARTGRTDAQVLGEMLDTLANWIGKL